MWNVGGSNVCYEPRDSSSGGGALNIIDTRTRMISRYNTPKELVRPIQSACGTYGRYDHHDKTFLLLIDGAGRLWSTGDYGSNFSDVTLPQITKVKQIAINDVHIPTLLFIGVDNEGKSALFSRQLTRFGETKQIDLCGSSQPTKIHTLRPPPKGNYNFQATQENFIATTDGRIHQILEENPSRDTKHERALITKLCSLIMKHTMNGLKEILWKDLNELVIICEDGTCELLKLPAMMAVLRNEESLIEKALGYVGFSPNSAQSSLFSSHPQVEFACQVNHALMFRDHERKVSFISLENGDSLRLDEHINLVNVAPITHGGYSAIMMDFEGRLYTLGDDLNVNLFDAPIGKDEFSMDCALDQGRQKGIIPSMRRKSVLHT